MTVTPDLLLLLHVAAAILSCWRLTDLLVFDRLSAPLRERLPYYLFRCPRCLSVWTGATCTAAFAFFPWLNWPLALSWLFLERIEMVQAKRQDALDREQERSRA